MRLSPRKADSSPPNARDPHRKENRPLREADGSPREVGVPLGKRTVRISKREVRFGKRASLTGLRAFLLAKRTSGSPGRTSRFAMRTILLPMRMTRKLIPGPAEPVATVRFGQLAVGFYL